MGETSRERWHRLEKERAEAGAAVGSVSVGHPDLKAGAPMAAVAAAVIPDLTVRLRLQQRQNALLERFRKLGLAVLAAEMPADDTGLLELEKFAAESEAGK